MDEFDTLSMPPRGPFWRVQMQGLGKVANADIEMAPLVVLLGRNNTGKSYVASLLWGMLNFAEMFLPSSGFPMEALPEWYQKATSPGDVDEAKDFDVNLEELSSWLNEVISSKKNEVVERLLSIRSARIDDLTISFKADAPGVHFIRLPSEEDSSSSASLSLTETEQAPKISLWTKDNFKNLGFISRSFSYVVDAAMTGTWPTGSAEYLPAARTGLMLALKPLVASALETLGLEEKRSVDRLPLPTIRFLQNLAKAENDPESINTSVAAFLEESVLKGRILKDESDADPSFSYETASSTILPLHASSSMVTELAPLLVMLRGGDLGRGLIFEEPEAHLHMAAQRSMARAIARIVNNGIPVVLTTHSDTFVQELNLLLQIEGSPSREQLRQKYNYDYDELISSDKVAAYEFVEEDGKTFVVRAEIGEFGIVAQSLNETLIDLAEEVMGVQAFDPDQGSASRD